MCRANREWWKAEMKGSFAFRHESDAGELRCSFPRPGRRTKTLSYAPDDIGSCHHRVIEVGSSYIVSNQTTQLQKIAQVTVQALLEDIIHPVITKAINK